jgi:hypothetical protein
MVKKRKKPKRPLTQREYQVMMERQEWLEKRDLEMKLGLRLIDIGYKRLAREFHPDLSGSSEEMVRLNLVRERLKSYV